MGHGLDGRGPAPARRLVAHVAEFERQQPRMTLELGEVGHVAGDQVVDRQHLVPAREQLPDDPAADEPGGTGHEDPHGSGIALERRPDESRGPGQDVIGSTRSDR